MSVETDTGKNRWYGLPGTGRAGVSKLMVALSGLTTIGTYTPLVTRAAPVVTS